MSPVPILVLLQQCIGALGGLGTAVNDPANKVALELLVAVLDAAPDDPCLLAKRFSTLLDSRRAALRTAALCALACTRPRSASPSTAAAPATAKRRGGALSDPAALGLGFVRVLVPGPEFGFGRCLVTAPAPGPGPSPCSARAAASN